MLLVCEVKLDKQFSL